MAALCGSICSFCYSWEFMDFLLVMGMGWLKNGFGSFGDGLVDLFFINVFYLFFL
jgi:hypothetical protein